MKRLKAITVVQIVCIVMAPLLRSHRPDPSRPSGDIAGPLNMARFGLSLKA